MNRTLRSSHTRFIVVINPYYAELTPLENAFSDEFLGAYGTPGSAYNTWQKYPLHNPLHDVVHKSGVARDQRDVAPFTEPLTSIFQRQGERL